MAKTIYDGNATKETGNRAFGDRMRSLGGEQVHHEWDYQEHYPYRDADKQVWNLKGATVIYDYIHVTSSDTPARVSIEIGNADAALESRISEALNIKR